MTIKKQKIIKKNILRIPEPNATDQEIWQELLLELRTGNIKSPTLINSQKAKDLMLKKLDELFEIWHSKKQGFWNRLFSKKTPEQKNYETLRHLGKKYNLI